jgi:hypothetical protein
MPPTIAIGDLLVLLRIAGLDSREAAGAPQSRSTQCNGFAGEGPICHLCEAVAEVRSPVWARSAANGANPLYLDIDASLVEIHSENKDQTGLT